MGIARTFQNIRLFSNMSVLDNVKVGMHNSHPRESWPASLTHGLGYRKAERLADGEGHGAAGLLCIWTEHAKEQAGSLPYGAQRRLEIVRALATEPKHPAAG